MFPMYQGLTNLFPSEAVLVLLAASNGVPHRADFLQCYVNNLVELFGIPSDDSIPEALKKSFEATRRFSLDKLVAVIRMKNADIALRIIASDSFDLNGLVYVSVLNLDLFFGL